MQCAHRVSSDVQLVVARWSLKLPYEMDLRANDPLLYALFCIFAGAFTSMTVILINIKAIKYQ